MVFCQLIVHQQYMLLLELKYGFDYLYLRMLVQFLAILQKIMVFHFPLFLLTFYYLYQVQIKN